VPGHGPITDTKGVKKVQEYLNYINQEAQKRFDAGLSVRDAAHDISLGDYEAWGDAERIVVNVDTLYREFDATKEPTDIGELFSLMAEIKRSH
jgi:hypothetical protein